MGIHRNTTTASTTLPDRTSAIRDAAAEVFMAHGFSAATTDMIQRQAKVSKATLYGVFPTKDAMFAAVVDEQCSRMAQAMAGIAQQRPGQLRAQLLALGQGYLRFLLSPGGLALYRVVVAAAPRFPALARHFYVSGPQLAIDLVRDLLDQATARGELRTERAGLDAAALLFLGMLRGNGQLECLTHPDTTPSLAQTERWAELAVDSFLQAFGTPAADAARPTS